MTEKNHWTQHQDQLLKTLKEDRHMEKWSQISQVMKQQYHIDDRNGKQCRERYTNHLDPAISKKQWTQQQDLMVYQLHNQYGNKWAIIAERLQGRSDNCIKNHFYSRLRKGLRKINKVIEDEYKKTFKQFKIIDLYKVIQASDQKFKEVKTFTSQMTDIGHGLKNRLFIYAEQLIQQTQQYKQRVKQLLQDFTQFTKNYKRKSKKSRRYSPMGVDSVYRANNIKKNVPNTEDGTQQDNIEKIEQQSEYKQQDGAKGQSSVAIVKIQEQVIDRKQQKVLRSKQQKPKQPAQEKQIEKQKQKVKQIQKVFVQPLTFKKQIPSQILQQGIMRKNSRKNKDFRHFSDDQDQQKNQAQYVKQQRLNHFAQNILKTFKSYYSFQSFKSNSVMDQPFFQ